jgi:anthraniloyl-CoA monooxygenase
VARLFADHLEGHRILGNRSIWRRFPTISCERWSHENVVLLGDAVHTAHFSIGSGTKLAMEDAIALVKAYDGFEGGDPAKALAAYEAARRTDVAKIQRAAAVSQAWFEDVARYAKQDPVQFTFNLMTRSRRITFDNLALRDPILVDRAARTFAEAAGCPVPETGRPPRPALVPLTLRSMALENRIVVSPMCQYSAKDGLPNDWHLVHLGSRAVGGAGLVFGEATGVSPIGRITHGCTGIYDDAQVVAWRRVTDFVHARSRAKVGLQIGHAGRKASCQLPWVGGGPLVDATAWPTIGPSAVPFEPTWHVPREMTYREIDAVCAEFAAAAQRTRRAGFDAIEIHMAHGYLLSSFISPLSNRRADRYGGDLGGRMRFPLEVLDAVREVWPADAPVFVRISASDWMEDGSGITDADAVEVAKLLAAHGADVIDVSSGGTSPLGKPVYGRMYQTGFADRVRHEAGVTTMAVGGIETLDHADTILAAGRADLCAIARAHLTDPYLTLHAAAKVGSPVPEWPDPYAAVRPRRP